MIKLYDSVVIDNMLALKLDVEAQNYIEINVQNDYKQCYVYNYIEYYYGHGLTDKYFCGENYLMMSLHYGMFLLILENRSPLYV